MQGAHFGALNDMSYYDRVEDGKADEYGSLGRETALWIG
jgi:hypothetical protein